ncbi:SH3 domain-containing protein [Phaeobacter sp. HF9A]|uniref:SH3 domain-containing protein n=1 Tax=Phaeobacter sp. HF9A TaxID=2721561 RepID=UPI001431CCE7|nr:SH3 domain-containing protein [Phaeobacter sp. HF9A]NIZ15415.1 SH3 domain-containing protein [Phaeobacter sp. HF9A]
MSRFLIVSFAGLALAFYELSGGADFKAPERPTPVAQAQDTRPAPGRIATRPAETQLATPVLSRYEPPRPQVAVEASASRVRATPETPVEQAASPQPALLNLATSGLQITQLEGGLGAITTAAPSPRPFVENRAAEPLVDIRRIRASRANIRLGPSTQFPVMKQMLAGDRVRVLSEDPSGWALLETPDTGEVGWIAASLLSAKGS